MDKQAVRAWKADYERHNEMVIEEMRQATFADRLEAFNRIIQFGRHLQLRPKQDDSEVVQQRWRQLRERYGKAG